MALSLANAAPLKPEIKLAQALSEFEAVLADDQKTKLRTYRGQSPPNPTDVMRFTAEIDRDAGRNRKSRQCIGTRLTNVLHAVQQFSTVVDLIVGSSQSQIAGAIWGTVKVSLQLASAISAYFDQLSTLFMRIGLSCPRYQDFGLLYPKSVRLQSALCEYFVVIVRLCKQAVVFLQKPFWSQLSSSILKPFESEFGSFHRDLEILANAIREEISLASNQAQQNEAKEMSGFRAIAKKVSDTSTRDLGEARTWKRKKAELLFLNACSVYNHETSWKQARKRGNTNWICHDEGYKQWKQEEVSSTLWCTGMLGSGKTVLSANLVEDLKVTTSAVVAYFFCRHDESKSLKTRTIIGSIARQIFDHVKSDIVDTIAEIRPSNIDTDQILEYLQELLPSNSHKYFIVIDGLDECKKKEIRLVLQCLKQLLTSRHVFRVYCSSRPDLFRWTHALIEPKSIVSMSQTSTDIEEYVEDALEKHLESGYLSISNPMLILTIQEALLENAHGMFSWVAFQIESICSQKTDDKIRAALKDLPKDLPETFDRILRNLQLSNAADPRFCRKIFNLMAAAQRPLTLEELREAVSVEPGETTWDPTKLVNDMLKSLLESCGSLVAVDEEHSTVHFAHHSVKQHLLSEPKKPEPKKPDLKRYHINLEEADLYLGDIIVTYLNFRIFDRQLTKAKSTRVSQVVSYPSAILGSLPESKFATRLAVKLLKSRGNLGLDIQSQLKTAAGIVDGSKETQSAHPFLAYAQDYWLFHTKAFTHDNVTGYSLWRRLADGEVNTVKLPWEWAMSNDESMNMRELMKWGIQNEHWALIDRGLFEIDGDRRHDEATKLLLELSFNKVTDIKSIDFAAELYRASCQNNKVAVLLSLRGGADINASYEDNRNALQAASNKGHEEIVRFLLTHGANVNAESEKHGNALYAASSKGHEKIVRLLLGNGADINATGGHYGNALHAASRQGHEEIVRLLLENGANVNAKVAWYGNVLQAASYDGHKEIVILLLRNGANINATGGRYGDALHAAWSQGREDIVRLLLENGANVNETGGQYGNMLQTASFDGHEEIVRLLLENGANVNATGGHFGNALQAASSQGHEDIVRLLLENEANVNETGGHFGNALQAASYEGREEIVRLLLENEANVNETGGHFGTALQAASHGGHEKIVRLLLENGENVNAAGGQYGNVLQAASYDGHEEIVRLLLENGADVNETGGHFGNALQAASHEGHSEIVRLLLKNGANVNATGGHYGNALHAASSQGHEDIVRLLLENGENVNATGGHFGNALQAASSQGHEDIVRLLLENEANVNETGGHFGNALQAASYEGREEIVRLLLKNGANVNVRNGEYGNALYAASKEGHEKIVRLLLESGANVNATFGQYDNVLQAASYDGHEEIVRLLLENGANVNATGGHFGNALQAASHGGHEKIVRLLLEKGANVNVKNGEYGNALYAASKEGHEKIVRLLLESGANVNAESENYGSALQIASRQGYEGIVRLLLKNGANVNAKSGYYGAALQVASYGGHKEIARLLLENGADVNVKAGSSETPLVTALRSGRGDHEATVQLLLDRGAIADAIAMDLASRSGNKELEKLIGNALKSQSPQDTQSPNEFP